MNQKVPGYGLKGPGASCHALHLFDAALSLQDEIDNRNEFHFQKKLIPKLCSVAYVCRIPS